MVRFNPYRILGLPRTTSPEEIKSRYKTLVKRYHPDRFFDAPDEFVKRKEEQFKRVQDAYDFLLDPEKRRMYDDYGLNPLDEKSRITMAAMSNLKSMFMNALDQIPVESLIYTDIFGQMREQIGKVASNLNKQISILQEHKEKETERLEIIKTRLKHRNKKVPNIMLEALEGSLAALPGKIGALYAANEINKEMLRLMDDFEYRFTLQQQTHMQVIMVHTGNI